MLLDSGLLLLCSPKSSVIVSMDTFMYPLNECKCTHLVGMHFSRERIFVPWRVNAFSLVAARIRAKLYIHTDTYSSTHADTKG